MQCVCVNQWIRSGLFLHLLMQISRVQAESTANSDFYTAGVVEFRPTLAGMSSSDLVVEHLKSYVDIIESEEAEDTDIIVFPEGTLNNALQLSFVPSDRDLVIPCLESSTAVYEEFLVELSCAARRVRKYLVINLSEKEDCTGTTEDPRPCASNGLNVYNTNVVFDREGRVVSRYRKFHVYVEDKNTTLEPEYGIFNTDFGVMFGHFICFDILFYSPAQELVVRYGITDIVFTSMFYSELPFLTATQLQHGWAWGNNVNLLAAGASYPQSGTTGTGIYAGDQGALISVMAKGEGERKLYKARIKKKRKSMEDRIELDTENYFKPLYKDTEPRDQESACPNQTAVAKSPMTGITLLKDPQITNYNSILIDPMQSLDFQEQLCFKELCCSFDIVVDFLGSPNTSSHYHYRIGAFDGRRSYQKEEWSDIKVCALYACAGDDIESCGETLEVQNNHVPLVFRKIHINGSFPNSMESLIMPTTIDYQLDSLTTEQMQWRQSDMGSYYDTNIILLKDHSNLMTFGIYAMYYEKSDVYVRSSSKTYGLSIFVHVILIEIYKIFGCYYCI